MTPLETLKAARDLISDPARWTQGEYARNADGAIQRFTEREDSEVDFYLKKACSEKFQSDVVTINDTHTHAEVIALFDAAITELEGV